ncbi:MAG: DUF1761 domain-containing protein [Saprospiraceae bacterium]|nr:DUF1761 domain-containing protein [Saprospiraceae bacterium]
MENINILSVIIAALIPTIIGFIWYSPMLFQKSWMDSIGMTEEKMKSVNMPLTIGLSLITSFLLLIFLINFNNQPGQEGQFDTFGHGAFHSIFLMITFVLPILLSKKLYEQSSWKNLWINLGYWAVTIALMGGVLDMMNHWPNVM